MKEPIEELFKQSLKGHEMPYNADAWKAMSAKLDAVQPVATPKSNLKYYLGAAGIGAAAIATYFFFTSGEAPVPSNQPIASKTTKKEAPVEKTSNSEKKSTGNQENTPSSPATNAANEVENNSSTNRTVVQSNSEINTNNGTQSNATGTTPHVIIGGAPEPVTNDPNNPNSNGQRPIEEHTQTVAQKITLPVVADICLNESVTIENKNEADIYLLDAVGNVIKTIPAKKAAIFQPKVVGTYALAFQKDGAMKSGSNFQVNRIPDADFTVDLINKFEQGLPSTHVAGISGQGTYIWKADGQIATGVETDLHFYEKGEQTIELTVNNGQCAATVEKTVYIENDYNLMAVNSFTPTSTNPRNTTFIPFALTQRDVKFEMTIIDSRDGAVVYKTTDASLPWDGTDIRLGRRSETPQVYVWKVVILNPAPNEPGEYAGTVTMN